MRALIAVLCGLEGHVVVLWVVDVEGGGFVGGVVFTVLHAHEKPSHTSGEGFDKIPGVHGVDERFDTQKTTLFRAESVFEMGHWIF